MIGKKALLGMLLAIPLVAGGCVNPAQQRTERDLAEMKRRLANLERQAAAPRQDQEVSNRLDALGRQQADLQAAMDDLRVQVQTVSGRLEDLAHQTGQVRDQVGLVRDDLGLKVAALEDQVKALAARPAAPAPVQTPAEKAPDTPQALYQQGLELIQKDGAFVRGQEVLHEFLQRYPDNALAVNARYWIGEAYYGEKKYENAILQFQDVIQKYPDHPKVPAALLKQGLAFYALGDVKNARVILQKVIDSYPQSQEAAKAREKLAQWPNG